MEVRRSGPVGWQAVQEDYTSEQVESILGAIGVEIISEPGGEFLCLCPFHGNNRTPSFSINGTTGLYVCYNPSCAESGTLRELVKATVGGSEYDILRLISSHRTGHVASLAVRRQQRERKNEIQVFPQEVLDRMKADFWNDSPALAYMRGRGFEDETLKHFGIGYSAAKNMVATPMYDAYGTPVGVIGRTIDGDKAFKNSVNLPTSKTLWNLHNAKRAGDTVVLVEANFDAMRVHQAGFPCVVACLGGNFSEAHADQLAYNFSSIIVMSDFDDKEQHKYANCKKCKRNGLALCAGHNPGRMLGEKVAQEMATRAKVVKWAAWEPGLVYPHGAKDAGDMTDAEIAHCIRNAVTNFTYRGWKVS
jgi:DNA primase